jgi:hypothetical protein
MDYDLDVNPEKLKRMIEFAKKAKEYVNQESCDDPEDWFIPLFQFCEDFLDMFEGYNK